ncbi:MULTISPECIES: nitroreductase [Streptomyces]|uniref:Nitroreductase n=3 Tax=Streptomyces TaxID=1883 RepID=A0A380MN09_STRGR|nr:MULTISPECIES: nitroreductase [Streptomyces]NEE35983.1 oxidoreductase [Streptomyces sp. SID7982]NEE53234.1 oxidoreductase [Streptomyces sp. SID8455]WSU36382.1 nitroreductase family protein [Streptomyces gougerotii]MDQ0294029.1 nitroreductase [Streptomyces sp. DSM 41037]PJM82064.1 oxidoreductase [Streptomyces sp. TSRI0384-2]
MNGPVFTPTRTSEAPAGGTRTGGARTPEYTEQLIRGRRAIRAFRPDPVPEETLRGIFSLAGAAPSNSNAQPWRVEVVSGARRDRLADALRTAHAERRVTADYPYSESMYAPVHQERRAAFGAGLYGALGIGPDDHPARAAYDAESLGFYGAPHAAFLFVTGDGGPRLAADAGAYLQTLLLAMTGYGVASCPQGLLSFHADTVRGQLGVDEGKLLVGVSFGYADESAPVNRVASGRAALEATTTFHA